MYKLVVLCAFFAIAAAKPGVLLTAPVATYTTYVAPASTTITKQASSIIHPSPIVYSAPLAYTHLIKKRSPQLPLLVAPGTYTAASPLIASTYSAPLISTPLISSNSLVSHPYAYTTHFIKKRSAPILSSYIAPTSYSHQSRIDLQSTPLITSYASPWAYSAPYAAVSHVL